MNQSKRKLSSLVTQLSLTAAITFASCHSAFAVDLPDRPLLTEASIEPNVMIVLDDSGSMVFGFTNGEYDRFTDYANCPNSIEAPGGLDDDVSNIASADEITAETDEDGNAFFTYRGTSYVWGTTPGNDSVTGLPRRCFRDDLRYRVQYSEDFDNISAFINTGSFTRNIHSLGNFWNYYFSNEDQTRGDNWGEEDQKFGVGERIEVAQDAAKLLIRNLDGVRIGLAGFDGSEGGRILANVDSIERRFSEADDDTHRQEIIDSINTIEASGSTPLGETLAEVARYFVEGFTGQEVRIHPNNITGTESSATLGSLFPNRPRYEGGTVAPSASDPVIQAFCQENFTVLLTDGAPTGDETISSGLRRYDSDGVSGVFDDFALALYDIDLRPDLNEFDGTFVRNNMSTYVISGFGLDEQTIIRNVVNNGVGFGVDPGADPGILYQASSGAGLVDAFDDIFEEIFSNAGSLTSVTFNSGSIELDTALFQATFSRSEFLWQGNLFAFPTGNSSEIFSPTPMWNAADELDERVENASDGHVDRDIITMADNNSGGVAFTEANFGRLSERQRMDLTGGSGDAAVGFDVLNYIRGESNPLFRDRSTFDDRLGLLGDIVNSSPIEVGEPEINYPEFGSIVGDGSISEFGSATRPYSAFRAANANRESMVYAGANDGMLHAFRGDPDNGGQESFAYIPSMVFDDSSQEEGLYYLTNTEYEHRFYVDGSLTASDIFIDPNGGSSKSWRTVLVGGLRAGGKGIFALDITDPTSISEETADDLVLWEFAEDDDMGHVYGDIRVAKMANGKWAAIVGNGYNSVNREAKVFIIFFEEGSDGVFAPGDWIELDTGVGGDNGMATPVLGDLNGDFIPDRIYAGDLRGNMWVFDVSDTNQDNWGSAYKTGEGTEGTPEPLFTARNVNGDEQPITTIPIITLNNETTSTGNGANVLVFFGTGQFVEIGDFTNTDNQSFYAVWDRGDQERDRGDLEPRILNTTVITNSEGNPVTTRTVSGNDVVWFNGTDGEWGWFMDFPEPGERVVVEPAILQGTLFFASSIPTTSACSNGGRGFLNSVSTTGLAPTTPLFDVDGDGLINEDDVGFVGEAVLGGLPSGSAFIGGGESNTGGCPPGTREELEVYTTSSGTISSRVVCPPDSNLLGRLSWQEMLAE